MDKPLVKFYSAADIKAILKMDQAIDAMRDAFSQLSLGNVVVPPRMHLDIFENNGVQLLKPVYSPKWNLTGIKIISLFKENTRVGLPLSHAVMIVFDGKTGVPISIMDGGCLTAIRTGAASGLATDLLANDNVRVAAIFGAGPQGRTQLEAITHVRKIELAYIFDLNIDVAQTFADDMSEQLSITVEVAPSKEVLKDVDIVSTVTTSSTPVFSHNNLKEGVHINAMGSFKPDVQEIPNDTICCAKLVVDQREMCFSEAGDVVIPLKANLISKEHVLAELGEIVAGIREVRRSEKDITLFKSVGNAIQDLAAAQRILELSNNKDVGIELIF